MTESRILVVDSDGDHAGHCDAVLSSLGFKVTLARDTTAAASALSRTRFDAVLLDAMLDPGMLAMREPLAQSDAVVFAMSDILLGPTNRELSIALHGCADFLPKPVSSSAISTWLKRALADRFPAQGGVESVDAARPAEALEPEVAASRRHAAETPARGTDIERSSDVFGIADALHLATPMVDMDTASVPANDGETTVLPGASAALTVERTPAPGPAPKFQSASSSGPTPVSVDLLSPDADSASDAPEFLDWNTQGSAGGLDERGVAAVLGRLGSQGASGTLAVAQGAANINFSLAAGRLVGVRSTLAEHALGTIVVADGLARADQLEAIARNLGEAALEELVTYINAGLIPAASRDVLCDIVARRRAVEAFSWTEGTWRFDEGEVTPECEPISIPQLAWEAARFAMAPESIALVLRAWMERSPTWLRQPPGRADLALTRWQRAIIGSIDGEATLSEVLEGVRDRLQGLALVYTLVATGYVAFTRD